MNNRRRDIYNPHIPRLDRPGQRRPRSPGGYRPRSPPMFDDPYSSDDMGPMRMGPSPFMGGGPPPGRDRDFYPRPPMGRGGPEMDFGGGRGGRGGRPRRPPLRRDGRGSSYIASSSVEGSRSERRPQFGERRRDSFGDGSDYSDDGSFSDFGSDYDTPPWLDTASLDSFDSGLSGGPGFGGPGPGYGPPGFGPGFDPNYGPRYGPPGMGRGGPGPAFFGPPPRQPHRRRSPDGGAGRRFPRY